MHQRETPLMRWRKPLERALRSAYIPMLECLEDRRLLATVTLNPIADATLFEETSNPANGAGQHLFSGVTANRNVNLLRRAILKFDVAGAIPAGSIIDSATLQLTVNRVPGGATDANMSVHQVLADWGEGTNDALGQEGRGQTPPSADAVTWRHRFFSASTWTNPGGDFDAAASASTLVAGLGSYQWTGSALVADVQQWLNSPSSQLGWLLRADQESSSASRNAKRFGARENPDQSERPVLTIEFTEASQPNKQPTLDPIADPGAILEDAGGQMVGLAGISPGDGETQVLTVTASSSNPGLIPNPNVSYVSPNASGSISYTPVANQSGSALITVRVQDDGGVENGGIDTIVRTFTVTVDPVNDAPTLDAISNPTGITEDSPQQTVSLSGIGAGINESQSLTVTAVSNNPALIPSPQLDYTSPNTTATLRYTPAADQFGSAVITVTVTDDGGTATGGVNTVSQDVTVVVVPVNDAPTIDPISSPSPIAEDAEVQIIDLSGVSAGPGEAQGLTVTAVSSNPTLIADPVVTYISPDDNGTLTYQPKPNQFGTSIITVSVMDDGGTEHGGVDTVTRSFTVTVEPVNDSPTLNSIDDPPTIAEDADSQTVQLSGITAGPLEAQPLRVLAVSSNTDLIPDPLVTYTSPESIGALEFSPTSNQWGEATITVTVEDAGLDGDITTIEDNVTTSQSFTVTVDPVNDVPTIDKPADVEIGVNAGSQTVPLTGITAGASESQPLMVVAVSSDDGIVPTPTIDYTSPNSAGVLSFVPVADAVGAVSVTITVTDGGLDEDLATAEDNGQFEQTFNVRVGIVNEPPTLDEIPDQTVDEDSAEQVINLAGITAGVGENQPLRVTASSDTPGLIPTPTLTYISPASTGELRFKPLADQHGTAVISVVVTDAGPDGDFDSQSDNAAIERTFTVTVDPVNDAPVAEGDDAIIQQDATTLLDLLGNDQDVDSSFDQGSFQFQNGPTNGSVSLNPSGEVEYTPNAGFFGTDRFSYRVADVEGAFSEFVDVMLTVNAAPLAASAAAFVKADVPSEVTPVISDPDGPVEQLQFEILTDLEPGIGQAEVVDGTKIRFTAGAEFVGSVELEFRVRDAQGGASETAMALFGVYNQNPVLKENVNDDVTVSPIDALLTINTLNIMGSRPIPPGNHTQPFFDVNADGFVSPIDALMVINFLNRNGSPEGEAVSARNATAVPLQAFPRSRDSQPGSLSSHDAAARGAEELPAGAPPVQAYSNAQEHRTVLWPDVSLDTDTSPSLEMKQIATDVVLEKFEQERDFDLGP